MTVAAVAELHPHPHNDPVRGFPKQLATECYINTIVSTVVANLIQFILLIAVRDIN